MTTNSTESGFVRLVRALSLLAIGASTTLGLSGCVDSDAVRKDTQEVADKIEQLQGVKDTGTSMLGTFHTGGGIEIEFDSSLPDIDFLEGYQAVVALAKSKKHVSITEVIWGDILFEPYGLSYDPAPLIAMKRIPGFIGASFTGEDHIYFHTPLAAVNAMKVIHEENLLSKQNTSWTFVTSKTEGQPSVDLEFNEPELAAMVPEFLTLPGLHDVRTLYGEGIIVTLVPGTDPAPAQGLASSKSLPSPRTIDVHVMASRPELTPSTTKPPA